MLLGGLFLAFKSPKRTDDVKMSTVYLWTFLLCAAAPYVYVEVQTASKGKDLHAAVEATYSATPFNGEMRYYKVLSCSSNHAHVLLVGDDKADWGGLEHPVLSVNLNKDSSGKWKADKYTVLASGRLNEDRLVLPPYF